MADGLDVKVLRSVDDIGKAALNSVADDGFFTFEWFKTLEQQSPSIVDPYYVAVYRENEIVAFAPCFIDESDSYFYYGCHVFPFMKTVLNWGSHLGLWKKHLLLCYSPYSFSSQVLVRKAEEKEEIVNLVSKKIDELCRKQRILFSSFPFVSEADKELMSGLQASNYLDFLWWKRAFHLDVHFSDFEDYRMSLGRKARRSIRADVNRFNKGEETIEELSHFGESSETLSTLYSNLYSRYNEDRENPYTAEFFSTLAEFAEDKVKVFAAKRNNEIVGFCLCLLQGNTLNCWICGFKYDSEMRKSSLYFNLVYYAPITWAIRNGIRRINYRIEAENVKLRVGCKERKVFSFLKCQNRLLASFFNLAPR